MAGCDTMAEALTKLLGCNISVVRDRRPQDFYQQRAGYVNRIQYRVRVEHAAEPDAVFLSPPFKHHGEVTRCLALLADLIQMGFVKTEENA